MLNLLSYIRKSEKKNKNKNKNKIHISFLFGREKLPHGTYVDLDSLLIGGCHDPNIVSDY